MKVATAIQMKNIDARAINSFHIPGIVLMENAAICCTRVMDDQIGVSGKNAVVLCGVGNNGGDGYAVARHLFNGGAKVFVVALGEPKTADAKINCDIVMAMGIEFMQHREETLEKIQVCDFIVDALYGAGFHGQLEGMAAWLAGAVNSSGKTVFAIDIPSGINADTGEVTGDCINAQTTITFTAYKPAHLLFPAADYCGEVTVCDISIPSEAVEQENIEIQTIEEDYVRKLLPKRRKNSHKGDFGKVLIIAGSKGLSGAAFLSSFACARSGAGLVTVCVPDCIHTAMEIKTTEVMTLPLPDKNGALSCGALPELLERAGKCDAVLFGPGLSLNDSILELLKGLLKKSTAPLIIDADGLNALSKDVGLLDAAACPILLTPHTVEMARLAGLSAEEVEKDRIDVARAFCKAHGVTVILKGAHSLVVTSDNQVHINNKTGNPGMATGGSGDVLGGMAAAFAARGNPLEDAAIAAVHLHGMAGDFAAKAKGQAAMVAGDIINEFGRVFLRLEEKQNTFETGRNF